MIDILYNEASGVLLVHDEPDLDSARSVDVDPDGFCSFVSEAGSRRSIRPIPTDILDSVRRASRCTVVRMEGPRPVSDRLIPLRHA